MSSARTGIHPTYSRFHPSNFLSHHMAKIVTAAVYADAEHICDGIVGLKQRALELQQDGSAATTDATAHAAGAAWVRAPAPTRRRRGIGAPRRRRVTRAPRQTPPAGAERPSSVL